MPPAANVLADLTDSPPSPGFLVTASRDGYPAVEYRTKGMTGMALFFAVWLTGWTAACVFMTHQVFFGKNAFDWKLALFSIPFWAAEFAVLATVLWLFFSVTTITFHPDRLRVERTLYKYQKRWEMARRDIQVVRQVKDGGEGDDSFPSWGLNVEGKDAEIKLLTRQRIEKSAWLGPIAARWAGVRYEETENRKPWTTA